VAVSGECEPVSELLAKKTTRADKMFALRDPWYWGL